MKNNIRETNNKFTTCINCKYFKSFRDEYDDELEPNNYGKCYNKNNKEIDYAFGEEVVCNLYKDIKHTNAFINYCIG